MNTKKGNTLIIILVLLAFIGFGGYFVFGRDGKVETENIEVMEEGVMTNETEENVSENQIMEKESQNLMMDKEESVMERADQMSGGNYTGKKIAGDTSLLLEFNQVDYERAILDNKLVVLYYFANWCPLCIAEFPKLEKVFNDLDNPNVIGFRVNFNDNETTAEEKEMARKFGVAYQHTKVFTIADKQILKSPESWNEARYISEIAKFSTN